MPSPASDIETFYNHMAVPDHVRDADVEPVEHAVYRYIADDSADGASPADRVDVLLTFVEELAVPPPQTDEALTELLMRGCIYEPGEEGAYRPIDAE